MEKIEDLVARAAQMSIREIEAHIQERSLAVDVLHAEKALLIPYLDAKWHVRLCETRGPSSLARVLNIGG